MKNSVVLYNVSAMFNRLFSTITPIKHILTLVALLCISSNMWGWRGAKIHVYSQPEDCGYVYANTSNSGVASNLTYDYAERSEDKVGNTTYSFYLFNLPKSGYKFMGYSDNKSATIGITNTNQFDIECGTAWWGNYKEKTYYAIFAPITYTIAFNGNGSTSGTMSNLSMVYNTAKNLTANAYARQYIVTYDADGGTSSVNSASATYSFVGWAKSPTGSVEYSDKQSVSNLTTTANAIVTLYAQWKSASVILPNATKVGAVIDGWYAGGVRVGEPGDSYTPTANVTLTAKWIDKYTPEITGNDYTLFVEGEQANAFSFKYTDNPIAHIEVVSISAVNDGSGKVISYDAKNNKIIAHNAGEATIYFTQQETETIKDGTSAKFTVKVSKHQTAFSGEEYSMMVDGKQTANYTYTNTSAAQPTASNSDSFYYTIDDNDFANEELNKGTDLITFNPSTKQITACNAGTAKITLHQKETYKYTGATASYNVTVIKYTPDFTWNTGNATYYYLSSISNIFTTTNPDCQYTIVSDNEHVAKVIDNTLHIYNVEETANITVTQAENYKWNGKTETYTITPENPNNHVTFTYSQAMFNDGSITTQKVAGTSCSWDGDGIKLESEATNWDDKYVVIHFEGVPKNISFKYKASTTNVSNGWTEYKQADWYIAESADGKEWSSYPWENLGGDKSNSTSWVTVSNKPLNSTTRYLKLCYSGNFAGFYSDIVVTELEKFEADPKTLDFGKQGVKYGEQVLPLNFSHANAGRITIDTIIGNDAKYFTVTPTVIPGTGRDMSGTAHLNVAFDNKGEDRGLTPYEATLVITDNAGNREDVTLTGIRHGKSTPVFTWNPNHLPYYFGSSIANIVVSSNTDYTKCPLTITSSNENIAKVEKGRLYIYETDGEVTFTVTQQGNDDYNEHTEKFTFTPSKRPELTVPFRATEELYKKAAVSVYWSNWDGANNEIRLGEDCNIFQEGAWNWEKKTVLFVFDGVPDKVSFQYRASNGTATAAQWNVEQSADGVNWESIWSKESSSTSWNTIEKELLPNTRYLRFSYSGNFAGYYKNIAVSELVGYKYLRAADGQYLSRGAKWGTQAVVDAFGVVARISRYTQDNENIYTRFFFVDNEQYMFETETDDDQRLHEVFTDNGTALNTNHLWQINDNGGILTIQSANEVGEVSHKENYIAAVNGVLAFTTNEAEATQWQMEDYTEHPQYIADMLNRQAANAAVKDFRKDINTLEKVRNRLKEEDFETHEITIPALALGEQTGEGRTLEGMPHIYEQTITGLDTGFYRLTVKALYRISNSEIAWKCNQEKGKESVLAYAYANNVQYPIQSVYASYHSSAFENTDELHDGKYYSTTLTSAEVAFNDANRYLNDVYVYVAPDPGKATGTLRYGIKCPSYVPGAWLAYKNITLTHFKRKEFIFEGKDDSNTTTPTQWTEQYNWNRDLQPNQYHVAIIQADVIIDTEVSVHSMIIDPTVNPNVTVTIAPNGGLTVGAGGVKGATTDNFIIKASKEGATKGQTGYIRISPYTEQPMPSATMEMYSKAYFDMTADDRNNVGSWQYVGSPMAEAETLARSIYKSSWIYNWNEEKAEWVNNRKTLILQPFEGYCTSQYKYPEGMLITNTGQLASNGNVILNLSYTGDADTLRCNVFANSYAAPIDITKFAITDFSEGVEKTINLFNTGSKNNIADQIDTIDLDAPGQYIAIPVATAADLVAIHKYPAVIPAMQGFFVNTTKPGTLKLDYERLVWNADYTQHANAPLRTKERSNTTGALCVSIEADGWRDNLYLLEAEKYDANYQNGYDARKMMNGELNIFAVEEEDTYLAVDATHSLVNTRVGVRTGAETAYTFTFANLRTQEPIALMDNETEQIIPIAEGTTYTFFATPNTMITNRFVIVANEDNDEGVATDIQNPIVGTKLHKFIKDNQLFILKDGIMYNAQGQLVSK
ncbi:MAG: InlB B-repeat-containing protein [Paludibacteraceae bacterium]|nr:InlB B-repeat-containing protein [Paludibacteraceae bacterium]